MLSHNFIASYNINMSTSGYTNDEIEIKLDLGSFTNYLKLIGFLGRIESEDHHQNVFFDTEDRLLSQAGWALRVRAENNRGLITVKSIPTRESLAVIRQEIEAEIPRPQAIDIINLRYDILKIENMPIDFIRDKINNQPLMRLVKFENIRQKKVFKLGDCSYVLEVDKTEYNDGSVDYELEMELSSTTNLEVIEDQLQKLFKSLDIPFTHQAKSKFHRALTKAGILEQ